MRGTTSIYTRSLSDLARLAAKPFIAKVRLELISARFLLSRCFRLFQQNWPTADIDGKRLVLSHCIDDIQRLVGNAVADRVQVFGLSAQLVEPSAIDEWTKWNGSLS